LKSFTKLYELLEENFADRITPDKAIYKGAIPGMLRTLDPHSNFFDPKDFQLLKEDQRGHYYGVGMTIQMKNGKTVIARPFGNSPAHKAGLRPGDIILEVNDKRTDDLDSTKVADLLKGPRGTPVQIKVGRDGLDQPVTFNIIRDEIPRNSVMEPFWIKPGIAFIRINSFSETTSREIEEGLKKTRRAERQGTRSRRSRQSRRSPQRGCRSRWSLPEEGRCCGFATGPRILREALLRASRKRRRDYPIVVLVNRYSASASEIVAGALQDHDRGWILGENTFGKGLVQTVFPLSENTGLALTTYHYYTPSGRLIQRDYSHQSFLDYYYHRNLEAKNPLDVKMTDAGRTVYGGGGIAPTRSGNRRSTTSSRQRFSARIRSSGSRPGTSVRRKRLFCPRAGPRTRTRLQELHSFMLKNNVEFTEVRVRREQGLAGEDVEARDVHHGLQRRGSRQGGDRRRSDGGQRYRVASESQGASREREEDARAAHERRPVTQRAGAG
jgi:carboxyl-terminal processing protease